MELPTRQLVVIRFGPDTAFGGELLGAAERIESGMSLRLLDILFVHRDRESGDLEAWSTRGAGASGVTSAVLDFRLDPAARRAASEQTLRERPELAQLGGGLSPGEGLVALLVEHRWAEALADAVNRLGGEATHTDFVNAASLDVLLPTLLEAR